MQRLMLDTLHFQPDAKILKNPVHMLALLSLAPEEQTLVREEHL